MKYRPLKGYKYLLLEDEIYQLPEEFSEQLIATPYIALSNEGLLCVKKNYMWDGPSGPTVDTKSFMRGSLIHDALYQLIREGFLPATMRKASDKVLYDICRQDGMGWFRSQYVYFFVHKCGGGSVKPREEGVYEEVEIL